MNSENGQPLTNGGSTSSLSSESPKVSPSKLSQSTDSDATLTNGHSEVHLESSVDDPPPPPILNDEPAIETESVSNGGESSPNDSPVTKEKSPRLVSHEREDSASSLLAGNGETDVTESSSRLLGETQTTLTSTSSSNRTVKGSGLVQESRSDSEQPVSSEVAVAYSPHGRFIKYDTEIGRGSFKTVYKGLDTETGVAIAWCELQEKRYNKAEQARFKEEVSILKTLQHPNILKLYDSWESSAANRTERKDKVLVLITELMTSGTLKSYMRRLKSIKPKVIRSWGRQILKGLYFLHTRMPPIIHRDLKCDNIFINGTTGLVKIGDLGLATLKRNDVTTVIGTPEFMAPEMYEESYDESVDVYAFGMCLLEMCTQEYPYMECSNPAQIYKRVSQGIKPHAVEKIKDASLKDIIEKCTTVDKEKRFNVLDLLNHEYFSENIKIEVVLGSEQADVQSTESSSLRTMRMEVPNQYSNKKNGQESIEFQYDLNNDVPEHVVRDMVKSRILHVNVQQMVSRSLQEYVEGLKHKLQGRNKTELTKPKAEFSQTPSPSPGTIIEAAPVESELTPAPLQRQASALSDSSSSKLEDQTVSKESTQGLDMTGQGAISTTAERERSMSLVMNKGLEVKTNDPLSPVSQPSAEQAPSTGQQIAASTGQPVPQANSAKELSAKSMFASNVVESKSYSLAVKEGVLTEKHTGSTLDKLPIEPTQETGYISTPNVQELAIPVPSDASGESTPIHQPSQSDDSGLGSMSNGSGTLKKKGQRQKGKGIKLTLIEHISETKKLVCQLATSNNKVLKYQFSIKYDKPEEMFLKFVNGGYLTEQDREEFILQCNQLIKSVKKTRDKMDLQSETKLGIQEQGKSRPSVEPTTSPPTEISESAQKLSIEQISQSDSKLSKNTGSLKLEPAKDSVVPPIDTSQILPMSETTLVTPEPLRDLVNPLSVPSNGVSVSSGGLTQKGQVVDIVSPLVTTQELPRPHSPNARNLFMPNLLNPAVPVDGLSSCSLPSLHTHVPVTVPVSQPLFNNPNNPVQVITTAPRVFEVETISEDKPDSPDTSDVSINSSTENLGKETLRSDSQDSSVTTVAKKCRIQSVPSLESKSDSYIGKEPMQTELNTNSSSRYSQTLATNHNSNPEETRLSSYKHNAQNVKMTRPSQRASQRIPEHYRTTPASDTFQRRTITENTYTPLYRPSNSLHYQPTCSYDDSEPLEMENNSYLPDRPVDIDELPQASLLSEAFMRFMHSMSMVFRDPTFEPLLSTLDRRFTSQQSPEQINPPREGLTDRRFSSQSLPVRSNQEVFERRPGSHDTESAPYMRVPEPVVSRSMTEPMEVLPESGENSELRTALEAIEEEQRKLDRKRQLVIQSYKRKHSSGNSSLESSSGLPDNRKVSTTSYDSYPMASPTQGRGFGAKLNEYEEAGTSNDNSSSTSGAAHKSSRIMEMEKRVRDELMGDKLKSDINAPSVFENSPSRSRTPHLPIRTTTSVSQPDRGGSVSPGLQTSPPPSNVTGHSMFQMHTSPSTKIARSDSNEWTDYTSAPVMVQATSGHIDNRFPSTLTRSTSSVKTSSRVQTSSRADVSEFDPITTNTNNIGPYARPKS